MRRVERVARGLVATVGLVAACTSLQQLVALRNVSFDLAGIGNGRLAGVELGQVASFSRLSVLDVGKITVAVARKDLPLDVDLLVRGENPADNKVTARMLRLAWSLYIGDKETISGAVDTAIAMPPGQATTFPVRVHLNLIQFFDGPVQDLVGIALDLAGRNHDPKKVSLRAIPTIDTPFGPMSYPSPITIISR